LVEWAVHSRLFAAGMRNPLDLLDPLHLIFLILDFVFYVYLSFALFLSFVFVFYQFLLQWFGLYFGICIHGIGTG